MTTTSQNDFDVDGFFAHVDAPHSANDGAAYLADIQPETVEPTPSPKPQTFADIITTWREEGPLVRVPTGIAPLDELCRGGLPIPWRTIVIGAPSAGKTCVAMVMVGALAKRLQADGIAVGVLAVDEEPEDLAVRAAQMSGFTVAQAELRDHADLDHMAEKLAELDVRLYDARWTIEGAAEDLAARAKEQGKSAALFIDSIHAAKSAAGATIETDSVRLMVGANVAAMRTVSTAFRMLVVATAEANRTAYRTEAAADEVNDLASGAESRAIEFAGQTLLMLRTPKGHADVIHVRVPKNRRARTGDFWLKLDRDRHTLTECGDPNDQPGAPEEREQKKRSANKRAIERDAVAVLRIIAKSPGIGERALRAAIKLAGLKIGVEGLDAILLHLQDTKRIENRPSQNGQRTHYFASAPLGE